VTAIGQNGGPAPAGGSRGGGGGGSGGGVLVAADDVEISGSISVAGGSGGAGTWVGGVGAKGRIKILRGASRTGSGTLTGVVTEGLLPPLDVGSTTHPDRDLVYNDDFPNLAFSFSKSFPGRQGYYWLVNTSPSTVPNPGNATFLAAESVTVPQAAVVSGTNYFHISSVDPSSAVGTVEASFSIKINTSAPTVTSSSHPSQTAWSSNADAFFSWTFPVSDPSTKGAFYVFDRYGDTVPTTADTFLPVTQKQLLRSGIAPGIWVLHVVAQDQRGYLTKKAGHYKVQIGSDPGSGGILGRVQDAGSNNVSGASVTVNRGLFNQTTNATGNYNFGTIPAGTWEVRVSKPPLAPVTKMVTVTPTQSTTQDFTL
jgi:hypothetical protein